MSKQHTTKSDDSFIGRRVGRWIIVGHAPSSYKRERQVLCQCRCGFQRMVPRNRLLANPKMRCPSCANRRLRGTRWGKWTVIGDIDRSNKYARVLCRCDCGVKKAVVVSNLCYGQTRGCPSCAVTSRWGKFPFPRSLRIPLYFQWKRLKRTGQLCDKWEKDLVGYCKAVAPKPPQLQLQPIIPGEPVGPGNWRWAKPEPQRKGRPVTLDGITMTVREHAARLGLTRQAIDCRLKDPRRDKWTRGRTPRRVTLDGVTMTIREHAERLGLTWDAVDHRLKHPRRDNRWTRGRPPRRVTLDGVSMTVKEHAARLRLPYGAVYRRLKDRRKGDKKPRGRTPSRR